MNFSDVTMAILSHHPVQLLATAVLLAQLARAIFFGPAAVRRSLPAGAALARGLDRRTRRVLTHVATGQAGRLAKTGR